MNHRKISYELSVYESVDDGLWTRDYIIYLNNRREI